MSIVFIQKIINIIFGNIEWIYPKFCSIRSLFKTTTSVVIEFYVLIINVHIYKFCSVSTGQLCRLGELILMDSTLLYDCPVELNVFGNYFGCLDFPELEVFCVALCEQVFLFRLIKERGFGVWPDTDALRREFWRLIFSLNCDAKLRHIFGLHKYN